MRDFNHNILDDEDYIKKDFHLDKNIIWRGNPYKKHPFHWNNPIFTGYTIAFIVILITYFILLIVSFIFSVELEIQSFIKNTRSELFGLSIFLLYAIGGQIYLFVKYHLYHKIWKNTYYELRTDSIIIYSGIKEIKKFTIPFSNISKIHLQKSNWSKLGSIHIFLNQKMDYKVFSLQGNKIVQNPSIEFLENSNEIYNVFLKAIKNF